MEQLLSASAIDGSGSGRPKPVGCSPFLSLFIPHMPKQFGSAPTDIGLTLAYFEPVSYTHLDVYKRQHKGIIRYTIGQRKGLGLALKEPMYVMAVDSEANTVTLGRNEDLFTKTLTAKDINLILSLIHI